jgi:acyl-CoA thioester hydrolase
MGYVYYGNYAEYFEVARVEALRDLGITYREMEDSGIVLPVLDYKIKYVKPAFYDELLTIKTRIEHPPTARIHFNYETFNEAGVLLNFAETTLVFINSQTRKPCQPPDYFTAKFASFYT